MGQHLRLFSPMNGIILLIEDEIELQQNLKEILEYNGFSIVTADHGQAGVTLLETQDVDLILCDIMMPVMDGYQFLKHIRSQPRFQHIPFIFLSAKASRDDKTKGLAQGANDYLTKPISARMLLNSIFALLADSRLKIQNTPLDLSAEPSPREIHPLKVSKSDSEFLLQLVEKQKKAVEAQDWNELTKQMDHAETLARRMQISYRKLLLYKHRDQKESKPTSLPVGDLILDKINELGPEKFLFRTRFSPNVSFDAEQAHFVLDELLDNAIRFSSPKSPIAVEYFGNELTIKNIPAQNHSNEPLVIEAFSRVGSDNGSFASLGLGLFLAKEYCHKNGAKLTHEVSGSGEFGIIINFRIS